MSKRRRDDRNRTAMDRRGRAFGGFDDGAGFGGGAAPPTPYVQVKSLAATLQTDAKVTARRAAGRELLSLLANPRVRARLTRDAYALAAERSAAAGRGGGGKRHHRGGGGYRDERRAVPSPRAALSGMWRLVLRSSLNAAGRVLDGGGGGRTRLSLEDVELPHRLLKLCEAHDFVGAPPAPSASAAGSDRRSPRGGVGGEDGESSSASSASHRGARLSASLGPDLVSDLLDHCLTVLGSPEGRAAAEVEMLEMLARLCSRAEYVGDLHPRRHVEHVLAEVRRYLLGPSHEGTAQRVRAAEAFCNLISVATSRLGIGLHRYLSECLGMVAQWCESVGYSAGDENSTVLPYVYGAATNLLAAHPEHAIPALGRYGRSILHHAKRIWKVAAAHGSARDSLVEYMSAHLLVCEVAGRLQGLIPGELGDVGTASLDEAQLRFLLLIVASHKELARLPTLVALGPARGGGGGRGGKVKGSTYPSLTPLPRRHRRHLELCARLLRFYQASFVVGARLEACEDVLGLFNRDVVEPHVMFPSLGDGAETPSQRLESLRPAHLESKSPWATVVGRFLHSFAPEGAPGRDAAHQGAAFASSVDGITDSQTSLGSMGGADFGGGSQRVTQLSQFHSQVTAAPRTGGGGGGGADAPACSSDPAAAVPFLQLICACAEAFPQGQCWSHSLPLHAENWDFYEHTWQSNSTLSSSSMSTSSCSPLAHHEDKSLLDLASVIDSIVNLMVLCGGATGNPSVQVWGLLALLKLTESSAIVASAGSNNPESQSRAELVKKWQRAWISLFRSDLRYGAFTADAYPNSAGELFLLLLTEMIRNGCTGNALPTRRSGGQSSSDQLSYGVDFVRARQADVWNLPAFCDAGKVREGAVFDVMAALIEHVGISDTGEDKIDASLPLSSCGFYEDLDKSRIQLLTQGRRRYRLLCFCLRSIELYLCSGISEAHAKLVPIASMCVSALVSGEPVFIESTFVRDSLGRLGCTDDAEVMSDAYAPWSNTWRVPGSSSTLTALWSVFTLGATRHELDDDEFIWRSEAGRGCRLAFPYAAAVRRKWRRSRRDSISVTLDFVSIPVRRVLREFAMYSMRKIVERDMALGSTSRDDSCTVEEDSGTEASSGMNESTKGLTTQARMLGLASLLGIALDVGVDIHDDLADFLVATIGDSIDSFPSLLAEPDSMLVVITSILGVFQAVGELSIANASSIPPPLKELATSIFEACKSMLHGYRSRSQYWLSLSSSIGSVAHSTEEPDSLFEDGSDYDTDDDSHVSQPKKQRKQRFESSDDSDDDQCDNGRGKRSHTNLSQQFGRKVETSSCGVKNALPPDARVARTCAVIMTLLDPSVRCCRIVADALVWSPEDNSEGEDISPLEEDVEPEDTMFCSKLLCTERTILRRRRIEAYREVHGTSLGAIDDDSAAGLCCELIIAGRVRAGTLSAYGMFGFGTCARLVEISCDGEANLEDVDVEDIVAVLNPGGRKYVATKNAKKSRRLLKFRPIQVRAATKAATRAFKSASGLLLSEFEEFFASDFLFPSLAHIDHSVRRGGAKAVGVALGKFPNQRKIVETILKNSLPPLYPSNDHDLIKRKFSRWINARVAGANEFDEAESASWMDARESMEATAIETIGIIIGSTTDCAIAREQLFFLISLSGARPSLVPQCFGACRVAAHMRGYESVEALIQDNMECLIQKWIGTGRSLREIPFLMCSPDDVEAILVWGKAGETFAYSAELDSVDEKIKSSRREQTGRSGENVSSSDDDDSMDKETSEAVGKKPSCASKPESKDKSHTLCRRSPVLDFVRFREKANEHFVLSNTSSLIPMIFLLSSEDRDQNEDGTSENTAWQYLLEATRMLISGESDDQVARVIRCYLQDIYAFVFPMVQIESSDSVRRDGASVVSFIQKCLSKEVLDRYGGKIADLVVLRILSLCSKGPTVYGPEHKQHRLDKSSYMGAIRHVASMLKSGRPSATVGLFEEAQSSTSEVMLYAKKMLDTCATSADTMDRWSILALIVDESIRQLKDSACKKTTQVGFCINELLLVLQDPQHHDIKLLVLKKVEEVIDVALNEECLAKCDDLLPNLNKLVICLLHLHAEARDEFIRTCIQHQRRKRTNYLESSGVFLAKSRLRNSRESDQSGDSVWGWDAPDNTTTSTSMDHQDLVLGISYPPADADTVFADIMKVSHDVLAKILMGSSEASLEKALGVLDPFPPESLCAYDQLMSAKDEKFSVTTLCDRFYRRIRDGVEVGDLYDEVKRFISLVRRDGLASSFSPGNASDANNTLLDTICRSQLAALDHLWKVLQHHRDKLDLPGDGNHRHMMYALLVQLCTFCKSDGPAKVRLSASRCVGELGGINWAMMSSDVTSIESCGSDWLEDLDESNPLQVIYTKAFEVLSHYVTSDRTDIALVAMETCKRILSTRDGVACWKLVDKEDVQRILRPFQARKSRLSARSTPELIVKQLIRGTGKDIESCMKERSWCWDDAIWSCPRDSSYEQWIRTLVCSLIWCCYEDGKENPSKRDNGGLDTPSLKGSSNFFTCCIGLCFQEHEFAAALFPGIIFDLLSEGTAQSGDTGRDSSSSSVRDRVFAEVAVGSSKSTVNRILSRIFSQHLIGSAHEEFIQSQDSIQRSNRALVGETHPRAVALAVDTLDFLRCVTQRRFLRSERHRRNPVANPDRAYPEPPGRTNGRRNSKSAELSSRYLDDYNADIKPSPTWAGLPWGVVLHLSGIDVAYACLRIQKYVSGLYYLDMYSDNRLGGAGNVLERISSSAEGYRQDSSGHFPHIRGRFDISGFAEEITPGDDIDQASDSACALLLEKGLRICLSQLQEVEATRGVDAQASAIRYTDTACRRNGTYDVDDGMIDSGLGRLLSLDHRLQANSYSYGGDDPYVASSYDIELANSLGEMGLRHVLQRYLVGLRPAEHPTELRMFDGIAGIGPAEKRSLSEKWFQNAWRSMQWDDSILAEMQPSENADSFASSPRTASKTLGPAFGLDKQTPGLLAVSGQLPNGETSLCRGFHECLDSALRCLYNQDAAGCKLQSNEARSSLLHDMHETIGDDSMLSAVPTFATKLQALNDLDVVARVVSSDRSAQNVLSRWGVETHSESSTPTPQSGIDFLGSSEVPFESQDFTFSVREVMLRALCRSTPTSKESLVLHLKRFGILARHNGRPDVAAACLQRLRHVRKLASADVCAKHDLDLHFEEAKILNCRNDFSGAIRGAKLVISHLQSLRSRPMLNEQREEADAGIRDILLSEALLDCGLWMTKYRVESAKSVLHKYLQPASDMANVVYGNNTTMANAKRAVKAHLTMAESASNLYDAVAARINSLEWKTAGLAAQERKLELAQCNEMFEELQKKRLEASSRSKQGSGSIEDEERALNHLYRHKNNLAKEVDMDTRERSTVENSLSEFLLLALNSYEEALTLSSGATDSADMLRHVFRMVSLWFSNGGKEEVNLIMKRVAQKVPSYRFCQLIYQLFSRIDQSRSGQASVSSTSSDSFQGALRHLVLGICLDHPYHGLVQLIALSNGNRVGRDSKAFLENIEQAKIDAAQKLLQIIRKRGTYVASLVDSYTAVINSYIELAMAPTKELVERGSIKDVNLSKISGGNGRGRVPSLDRCLGTATRRVFSCSPCILTKPPLLRPDGDYGGGKGDPIGSELIDGFESTFSLTETGIHRPKIVVCKGAKGGMYRQLVKGEDDIRQDAVMQQVFSTVNRVLRSSSHHTNSHPTDSVINGTGRENHPGMLARHLKIATYNIVPLSPESGILEWVDDSLPIGDYLKDKGKTKGCKAKVGAHSKYYPGEWGNVLCSLHFVNAPPNAKRAALDEIYEHFSPAFRFFFMEHFASLQAWHAAKILYARSCAVNSMVGHVLGIGDRHLHNILIRKTTGEVVHIDFGFVFEQGKCLTTPETVPFRLTRDIVDGMGPTGTDGVFSSAAEATMRLLRENSGALLTILSAVVADPLYRWSVSPIKARERQRMDDNGDGMTTGFSVSKRSGSGKVEPDRDQDDHQPDKNDAANRAIAKIKEKLQGYEDGTSGECQSVEGQVQLLINAARDPDNLCALFVGWAPWL